MQNFRRYNDRAVFFTAVNKVLFYVFWKRQGNVKGRIGMDFQLSIARKNSVDRIGDLYPVIELAGIKIYGLFFKASGLVLERRFKGLAAP